MENRINQREKISPFNNAVILLDKSGGKTSFELISEVKRIIGIKKIGHSGTLDKFATGLMVLCTGNATRLTRFFIEDDKRYRGRIKLGIETDTCDITGRVVSEKPDLKVDWDAAVNTLSQFSGEMIQVPPKFSALKINGKRASDRVRSGEDIDLAGRKIKIYSIDITGIDERKNYIDFDIFCSKGTYVRSVARDFGEKTGTGACLTELRRVSSGTFDIRQAVTIEELRQFKENNDCINKSFLLKPADALQDFSRIAINDSGRGKVLNGAPFKRGDIISLEMRNRNFCMITDDSENLIAIAEIDIDKWIIDYYCVFN
ncbi:MAG: tRNA pseudouridine(55) synthase TruB [Leptospirales bacterium]|nr:tRNA pseudouridine(55) synthase TruB [Leptospirales bacterium]